MIPIEALEVAQAVKFVDVDGAVIVIAEVFVLSGSW